MVSKLLNPVFLSGFLRPMLTAKMWEFWPEHAKSRNKAHAVSFLCQLIVLLYTNMLETGSQEGWVIHAGSVWLVSHTMQVPCILSNGSITIFSVLQYSLNIFLYALHVITKFLSSCYYKLSVSIKTFVTYF